MRHRRHGRRSFDISGYLPLLAGLIILVTVPLAVILQFTSARYAADRHETPTTAAIFSPERTSATPAPPPETTPEPEEAVSRYATVEISEEDIHTLACLVYHEARGEPFEGQVAVVEVVFNRCISEAFPDTVEEVVFQKYGDVWQFSPAPYLWTAEPSETQYEAVYTALSETEYNVTEETVYFSTSPYNEYISAVIGNHYFCEIGG